MKKILIIQTLIILAGAYYIYQMNRVDETVPVIVDETQPEASIEEPAEIITNDPEPTPVNSSNTIEEDLDGPTDQGMEWPVFEGDVEVR